MGIITASSVIASASEIVQDEGNVVWTGDQSLGWVNDGQRTLAILRPDAFISTSPIQLIGGTKQEITGRRIRSIGRNMGPGGATPGSAIRLVDRGIKDDFNPDWHTGTESTVVQEYMYDEKVPKQFYVYPPVHSTTNVWIEIAQYVDPTDCATPASTVNMDDVYVPALIEWVVYRFVARDAEEVPDVQRAVRHFTSFFSLLKEKIQADMAVNPKVREQLE